MKRLYLAGLLLAFLAWGCAHSNSSVSPVSSPVASFQPPLAMVASNSEPIRLKSSEGLVTSGSGSVDEEKTLHDVLQGVAEETVTIVDSSEPSEFPLEMSPKSGNAGLQENLEEGEEGEEHEIATIADPLEPFNRAMFQFNDKLYFWALKPVALGYNRVAPERARVSVKNFFFNLKFPVRFISCLLQANFGSAATELGRFTVNTIWGVGGLLDPSSGEQLNLPKRDADFGQTLGVYGVGQGLYIVWPILGPSSARDSVGIVGDFFLYPVSYITPWYDWLAVRGYEEVNDTSLMIGDYEALKAAAIDPYVALRDAYDQYRQKKVEVRKGQPEPPKPARVR